MKPFCRDDGLDPRLLLGQEPAPLADLLPPESMPPPALVELLQALLQKDPAERPAHTHQVRSALREASRAVPLAARNSLLEEARPHFRPESPEDLPPQIPRDLAREGRLRPDIAGREGPWRRLWRHARRPPVAAGAAAAVAIAGSLAWFGGSTAVRVERPLVQVEAGTRLPAEVSASWLVDETLLALRDRRGSLELSGPGLGAAAEARIYSPSAAAARGGPDPERLQIDLRCRSGLCIYGITREGEGESRYRQAVLLPEAPVEAWRQMIGAAVAALYP